MLRERENTQCNSLIGDTYREMKITSISFDMWQALIAEESPLLNSCWYNYDTQTPEIHSSTPTDLRPYIPIGDRVIYDIAISAGMTPRQAMDKAEKIFSAFISQEIIPYSETIDN